MKEQKYEALAASVPCIYGDKFMDVLPGGWDTLPTAILDQFKQELWRKGCERLGKAVESWNQETYKDTFLGLFVNGHTHPRYEEFKDFFPGGMLGGMAKAVSALPELYRDAQRLPQEAAPDDISLEQALVTLVDDFVEYISLVQLWPFFVQSVRCFQNQHAQYQREDLEWMFPIADQPT